MPPQAGEVTSSTQLPGAHGSGRDNPLPPSPALSPLTSAAIPWNFPYQEDKDFEATRRLPRSGCPATPSTCSACPSHAGRNFVPSRPSHPPQPPLEGPPLTGHAPRNLAGALKLGRRMYPPRAALGNAWPGPSSGCLCLRSSALKLGSPRCARVVAAHASPAKSGTSPPSIMVLKDVTGQGRHRGRPIVPTWQTAMGTLRVGRGPVKLRLAASVFRPAGEHSGCLFRSTRQKYHLLRCI